MCCSGGQGYLEAWTKLFSRVTFYGLSILTKISLESLFYLTVLKKYVQNKMFLFLFIHAASVILIPLRRAEKNITLT